MELANQERIYFARGTAKTQEKKTKKIGELFVTTDHLPDLREELRTQKYPKFTRVDKCWMVGLSPQINVHEDFEELSSEILETADDIEVIYYPSVEKGYVYFLKAETGEIKIGKSMDPDKRIGQFSPKLPHETEKIHTIKSNQPLVIEKTLHEIFEEKRKRGEWFILSETQLKKAKKIEDVYFKNEDQIKHHLHYWFQDKDFDFDLSGADSSE